MSIAVAMVMDFTERYGYPHDVALASLLKTSDGKREQKSATFLMQALLGLKLLSAGLRNAGVELMEEGDPRVYRVHLMSEELGELVEALWKGDEVSAAHESADLRYVVLGTDVTFGIPSDPVFREVHRSNMTKTKKDGDPRMSDKGDSYDPPDVAKIMADWRKPTPPAEARSL